MMRESWMFPTRSYTTSGQSTQLSCTSTQPRPVRAADGRDLARVVRLDAPDRHERVAALRERVRDEVLELARLVAPVGEAAVAVVALSPQARAAEVGGQAVERMDRGGAEEEATRAGRSRGSCADSLEWRNDRAHGRRPARRGGRSPGCRASSSQASATSEVREPHRHAYHELIWVREGRGRHLIDGEPVEFGPRTLTLIAKGRGAPVRARRERARRRRALRRRMAQRLAPLAVLGVRRAPPVNVPGEDADALRRRCWTSCGWRSSGPPAPESAELRRHLLSAALLWAQRWREADLEHRGASGHRRPAPPPVPGDCSSATSRRTTTPATTRRARRDDRHAVPRRSRR